MTHERFLVIRVMLAFVVHVQHKIQISFTLSTNSSFAIEEVKGSILQKMERSESVESPEAGLEVQICPLRYHFQATPISDCIAL